MLKKQVGFNLTHDSSVSVLDEDGGIELFVEEERLSRIKHDTIPSRSCDLVLGRLSLKEIEKYEVGVSGLIYKDQYGRSTLDTMCEPLIINSVKSLNTLPEERSCENYEMMKKKFDKFFDHHLFHAYCGFYNSGFDDAAVVVVDGMGNAVINNAGSVKEDTNEVASIFDAHYPNNMNLLGGMSTHSASSSWESQNINHLGDWTCGIGMAYSAVASYMGFGSLGSGKLMGLAPYGKEDPNIKSFLLDNGFHVDSSLFYRTQNGCNFVPYDYLPRCGDGKSFDIENNFEKLANLAWRLQEDFQTHMLKILLDAHKMTGRKNIILTGGCALNCAANYWYLDKLPKDVKLYVEPISTDAGVSLGIAKAQHYSKTGSMKKHPLKTLYLGPE